MVFGFFEVLLLTASSVLLSSAGEEVGRQLYTGQFQRSADNTEEDLKNFICEQAVLLQCNEDLLVDVRDFGEWKDVTLPKLINDDGSYTVSSKPSSTEEVDIGGERIVVLRIIYRWRLMTPGMSYFLRGAWVGNKFLYDARVFVVEPWDFLGVT